jgi:opacity protein-like surface antigen
MSRLKMLAIAGALTVQAAAAVAADMPQTLPPAPYNPSFKEWRLPESFNLNSGWYVRGDVGYNWGRLDSATSAPGHVSPVDNDLGDSFVGGLGAGFKSRWLRTDLTVDYSSPAKYRGTIATPDDVTAKISAVTALFNAYLDLGTWYHATPYIGGGVGTAYVTANDYVSAVSPPFSGDTSHSQWNFAWALMAGVGYRLSHNLMLDVGYRYVDFGDAKPKADANGAMTFKDVAAHEVRVGLRWSFDDLQ